MIVKLGKKVVNNLFVYDSQQSYPTTIYTQRIKMRVNDKILRKREF